MAKISKPTKSTKKGKSKYLIPFTIVFVIIATLNLFYFYYLKQSSCPEGYVRIPLPEHEEHELRMCVAKYEMKKDSDGSAVSKPDGLPWVKITLNEAIQACRANGKRYDLITNEAWNIMAILISQVGGNWNSGVDRLGVLNSGFVSKEANSPVPASADELRDNCINTGEKCDFQTWNISRRTHIFENNDVVWDVSGNVAEWVSGEIDKSIDLEYNYIRFLAKKSRYQFENFGPEYICKPEGGAEKLNNNYCGFGFFNTGMDVGTTKIIKIQNPGIVRGGNWKAPKRNLVGIFATTLVKSKTSAEVVGFRCTYSPMPQIRSFNDLPNILK